MSFMDVSGENVAREPARKSARKQVRRIPVHIFLRCKKKLAFAVQKTLAASVRFGQKTPGRALSGGRNGRPSDIRPARIPAGATAAGRH
jgi:hypothetical protein